VDLWVHTTLESYIIDLAAIKHQYFSKGEEIFKEESRGRLLQEIPLWINILQVEEGILLVPLANMEV